LGGPGTLFQKGSWPPEAKVGGGFREIFEKMPENLNIFFFENSNPTWLELELLNNNFQP